MTSRFRASHTLRWPIFDVRCVIKASPTTKYGSPSITATTSNTQGLIRHDGTGLLSLEFTTDTVNEYSSGAGLWIDNQNSSVTLTSNIISGNRVIAGAVSGETKYADSDLAQSVSTAIIGSAHARRLSGKN